MMGSLILRKIHFVFKKVNLKKNQCVYNTGISGIWSIRDIFTVYRVFRALGVSVAYTCMQYSVL